MMLRYIFLSTLLLSIFSTACKSPEQQDYERIERFETGAVSRRVQIVNGKKEGKMTDFYPDGKLMAERWFKNDTQEGRTVIYYPGGQIKEVQYYIGGRQYGGDTIWYENGQIQFTVMLENDEKNGYLRKWSPEGQLVFESRYAHDTLVEVKGHPINREGSQESLPGAQ